MANFKEKIAKQLVDNGIIKKTAFNSRLEENYPKILKQLIDALQKYSKGINGLMSYFDNMEDDETGGNDIFWEIIKKHNLNQNVFPGYSFDDAERDINTCVESLKQELSKIQEKERKDNESKSKTIYSVELLDSQSDVQTSTDCDSYDEAIQAMEKYQNNTTQYKDSWGLNRGRIIKYTQDEDGSISNEKVLKTFWL